MQDYESYKKALELALEAIKAANYSSHPETKAANAAVAAACARIAEAAK